MNDINMLNHGVENNQSPRRVQGVRANQIDAENLSNASFSGSC